MTPGLSGPQGPVEESWFVVAREPLVWLEEGHLGRYPEMKISCCPNAVHESMNSPEYSLGDTLGSVTVA